MAGRALLSRLHRALGRTLPTVRCAYPSVSLLPLLRIKAVQEFQPVVHHLRLLASA